MKRILLILMILLFPVSATSQELPDMPSIEFGEFDPLEWQIYAKRVLQTMFPQFDTSNVVINIHNIGSSISGSGRNGMSFSFGFLYFLTDKYEFAVVLAHEFGHIRESWGPVKIRGLVNELRADQYIIDYIPMEWNGPCALADLLLRLIEKGRFEGSSSLEFEVVTMARIENMKRVCLFRRHLGFKQEEVQ